MQEKLMETGWFATPNASKYLQQLCKHFAHKIDVSFDDTHGEAALPPGPAVLDATEQGLTVQISASDEEGLRHARLIIDDHLKRFAHRENFEAMSWQREG